MVYAKAIAAFIVPMIMTPLVSFGITADTTLASALEMLIVALITAASVYVLPNKQ